jgi:hypothetical protein
MKDCVIVTSIVEISDAPIAYAPTRSLYSHQQRFEQTLETIESIRTRLPDADIVLVECSPDGHYMQELEKRVDIFRNAYPNDAIQNGYNKSVCEAALLQFAFDAVDTSHYRHVFKMTGRYVLTDVFRPEEWLDERSVGCVTDVYTTCVDAPQQMHTFFYKLTPSDIPAVREALQSIPPYEPIELVMYNLLHARMKRVSQIGIEVRWSSFDCVRLF